MAAQKVYDCYMKPKLFLAAVLATSFLALAVSGAGAQQASSPASMAPPPLDTSAVPAMAPPETSGVTQKVATTSAESLYSSVITGEAFARPSQREFNQTLLMMGGLDVRDNAVADEYAKMNYNSLYRRKFKDDFEWNNIRQEIIKRIETKKEYFRVLYEFSGTVKIGRYNFETQDFPFIDDGAMVNVGTMTVLGRSPKLRERERGRLMTASSVFPSAYGFTMSQPLTFDRLKVGAERAEQILTLMQAAKNYDRILYVRFRFKVQDIDKASVTEAVRDGRSRVNLKGDLLSIDLFLDKDMTQHVARVPVLNSNL